MKPLAQRLLTATLFIFLALSSGACSSGVLNAQYTLDVTGSMSVGDPTNLQFGKLGIDNPEQQVLLGTMIVEVNIELPDALGVNITDLNASANFNSVGLMQLGLDPNSQQDENGGLIFLRDDQGNPLGASFLNMVPRMVTSEGQSIPVGALTVEADGAKPNELPLLGQLPVLGFLFNGQEKRAQITELVILLTPQIVQDLE